MSRLLVFLLILLGFVVGARTLLLIGARRFRGTLVGQLLSTMRDAANTPTAGTSDGSGQTATKPAGRTAALAKCSVCGDHVPNAAADLDTDFVCARCRG